MEKRVGFKILEVTTSETDIGCQSVLAESIGEHVFSLKVTIKNENMIHPEEIRTALLTVYKARKKAYDDYIDSITVKPGDIL